MFKILEVYGCDKHLPVDISR